MKIKSVLSFFLVMLFLQGCYGGRNSDRLNGQWICDARATLELTAESKGMSETQFEAGVAVLASMSLEIVGATKTLILRVGPITETSTFTVNVEGRNRFLLELTNASAIVEIKDKDTIWVTDSRSPGRTVVFKRQK